jgi:two-component system, NarL family, sensor histidine kinase UhpB
MMHGSLSRAHTGLAALRARVSQQARGLSIFERVIVANSVIIVLATVAGWWLTQHNAEVYHFIIDTTFIGLAALAGVVVNFILLRAAFAPLRRVLTTIQAVEHGNLSARVDVRVSDADTATLARAFNGMLDRLAEMRDEAAGLTLRAQEDERRRLALELHDQTGQSLTALTLHAQAIGQTLAHEQSEAAIRAQLQAERLNALAQRTLAEVQAIARQLRPSLLDDLGVVAALSWLAADAEERLGVSARVKIDGNELEGGARIPAEIATALYRIAQESLTNAVRHGKVRHVAIALRSSAQALTLIIADDGAGFTPGDTTAGRESGGLGLYGMRERARLLGGSLRLRSAPGCGCVVRATIPMRWSHAPDTEHKDQTQDLEAAHVS